MFYASQELLRVRPQSSSKTLAGEPARRLSQHIQPERANSSQILRFLTCGSVDDGKSTLIGRMLKDLDLVPEDTWESVLAESERHSFTRDKPDYSLLHYGRLIQHLQGITAHLASHHSPTPNPKS